MEVGMQHLVVVTMVICLVALIVSADIPQLISYQGKVTDIPEAHLLRMVTTP
jgi:hypothetical protein